MRVTALHRHVLVVITIIGICFISAISSASSTTPGQAVSSDTTTTKTKPKKQRVRKQDTSTTRTKSTSGDESKEEKGFFESLFASCFDGCLNILFGSIFGGDDEDEVEAINDYSSSEQRLQVPLADSSRAGPTNTQQRQSVDTGQSLLEMTGNTEPIIESTSSTSSLTEGPDEIWVKVTIKVDIEGPKQILSSEEGWMKISDTDWPGSGAKYTETELPNLPRSAIVTPQRTSGRAAALWDKPGGASSRGLLLTMLTAGTEITIVDQYKPKVVNEAPSESPNKMVSVQSTSRRDIKYSQWQLLIDVSTPLFTRGSLSEEYHYEKADSIRHLGYTFGGAIKYLPLRWLLIDGSFCYTHIAGKPQYNYVIGNKTDSPQESDLDILSVGIGAGQLYSFAGGQGFLTWNIGPTLYRVTESAKIDMYLDDDLVGHRTDEISVWKMGLGLKLEIGGAPVDRLLLSFYTRLSFVPWESTEENSLTLDYLDASFSFFNLGLSMGTAFY